MRIDDDDVLAVATAGVIVAIVAASVLGLWMFL